jgi:lactoylglutathione lyase
MRIGAVSIYVADQDLALAFWIERAGFELRFSAPMGSEGRWIEVGPPGSESSIVLYPRAMMVDWAQHKPSIVFECGDIHVTHEAMEARGVTFTQPPKRLPWGMFAAFVDPDGNWFGLRERRVS